MSRPDSAPTVEVVVRLVQPGSGDAVAAAVAEFGVTPRPLGPETGDPELDRYLVMQVPERQAPSVVQALSDEPTVDAAYVKPAGESP